MWNKTRGNKGEQTCAPTIHGVSSFRYLRVYREHWPVGVERVERVERGKNTKRPDKEGSPSPIPTRLYMQHLIVGYESEMKRRLEKCGPRRTKNESTARPLGPFGAPRSHAVFAE